MKWQCFLSRSIAGGAFVLFCLFVPLFHLPTLMPATALHKHRSTSHLGDFSLLEGGGSPKNLFRKLGQSANFLRKTFITKLQKFLERITLRNAEIEYKNIEDLAADHLLCLPDNGYQDNMKKGLQACEALRDDVERDLCALYADIVANRLKDVWSCVKRNEDTASQKRCFLTPRLFLVHPLLLANPFSGGVSEWHQNMQIHQNAVPSDVEVSEDDSESINPRTIDSVAIRITSDILALPRARSKRSKLWPWRKVSTGHALGSMEREGANATLVVFNEAQHRLNAAGPHPDPIVLRLLQVMSHDGYSCTGERLHKKARMVRIQQRTQRVTQDALVATAYILFVRSLFDFSHCTASELATKDKTCKLIRAYLQTFTSITADELSVTNQPGTPPPKPPRTGLINSYSTFQFGPLALKPKRGAPHIEKTPEDGPIEPIPWVGEIRRSFVEGSTSAASYAIQELCEEAQTYAVMHSALGITNRGLRGMLARTLLRSDWTRNHMTMLAMKHIWRINPHLEGFDRALSGDEHAAGRKALSLIVSTAIEHSTGMQNLHSLVAALLGSILAARVVSDDSRSFHDAAPSLVDLKMGLRRIDEEKGLSFLREGMRLARTARSEIELAVLTNPGGIFNAVYFTLLSLLLAIMRGFIFHRIWAQPTGDFSADDNASTAHLL